MLTRFLFTASIFFCNSIVPLDALSITTANSPRKVVWFRPHALRTQDNDALREALKGDHGNLRFIFLLDHQALSKNGGTASDVFTVRALESLNQTLQGRLDVIDCPLSSSHASSHSHEDNCLRLASILIHYANEEERGKNEDASSFTELFYLETYDRKWESMLQKQLQQKSHSLIVRPFGGSHTLLDYPDDVHQQQDQQLSRDPSTLVLQAIEKHPFASPLIPFVDFVVDSLQQNPISKLQPLDLSCLSPLSSSCNDHMPRVAMAELINQVGKTQSTNWGTSIATAWPATEQAAQHALAHFVSSQYPSLTGNDNNNDDPDEKKQLKKKTHLASLVSPYLARGLLSPRQVYQALLQDTNQPHTTRSSAGSNSFLRRIAWRDYAYAISTVFPKAISHAQPIRPYYTCPDDNSDPQQEQQKLFNNWKRGKTGFPLVDAGMRQLIMEGFMPQQVRLAVAACLVEGLNGSWKSGMQHFAEYLVDFDVVINTHMWMNAGGVGLDPYYIGLDYKKRPYWDADGSYVRQWCPELQTLPDRIQVAPESAGGTNTVDCLYTPWKAPASVVCNAGVELGVTYPNRICDEREGRRIFLQGLRRCRASWSTGTGETDLIDNSGNDVIDLGRGIRIGTFTPRSLKLKAKIN